LEDYKCFVSTKNKGAMEKSQEKEEEDKVMFYFTFFEEISLNHL
jgi:hypothetical protein